MTTKQMLRTLTLLCGLSEGHISEATSVPVARIKEALEGWPLRIRHRTAIETYTAAVLRQAYALACRRMRDAPELRNDRGAVTYLGELRDAYAAAFGTAIDAADAEGVAS
jgi:hypothetical protein